MEVDMGKPDVVKFGFKTECDLTHLHLVPVSIGSGNGLSPVRHQAII